MDNILSIAGAPTAAVLLYGFLLGLKHATEADHLAAVSTIVSERSGHLASALLGAFWGLGHTFSLFVAGILVLVLNFQIGPETERALEFCVGIMLTVLGVNAIRRLRRGKLHVHKHSHAGKEHEHLHIHRDGENDGTETHHGFSFQPRALIIGMIHGLAGSAALMLLVIPTIDSRTVGLLYIAIFGIGSIAGMAIMTFLVGLPFRLSMLRYGQFNLLLQIVAGAVSIVLGLWIVFENGFGSA